MFRDFFSFLQSSLQNGTTTKENVAEGNLSFVFVSLSCVCIYFKKLTVLCVIQM
jgi:hypothetical protein